MCYWESPDELPMGLDDDWGQRMNRGNCLIGVIKKVPQQLFSNTKRDFQTVIVLRDDTDVKEELDQILLYHVLNSPQDCGWDGKAVFIQPFLIFGLGVRKYSLGFWGILLNGQTSTEKHRRNSIRSVAFWHLGKILNPKPPNMCRLKV